MHAPSDRSHVIRVAIVDDDALIREGLRMIVEQAGDLEVVATAADGEEALRVAREHRPDVMLMDVRMPILDGIEATRQITETEGAPRVIILTTFELDEYVFEALRAGASGFLLKRTEPEQLVSAIRVVAGGEALLSPSVTKRLIEEFTRRPQRATSPESSSADRLTVLTEREREVLLLIARGLSNQELAEQLFIADNTVKTHVKRIFTKLGARDRAQAIVIAYESGLVP
jgi:DNA-binding NarL/FixJ family response regulator